jgi:carbohydrate-selective porin OprB
MLIEKTGRSQQGSATTERSLAAPDTIAFGFVHTKIGDPFRSIDIPLRAPMLGSEKAIELNYAAYLKPYLMCQPVFQYYWDVGGNSRVPDAAVMGFRVIIDF